MFFEMTVIIMKIEGNTGGTGLQINAPLSDGYTITESNKGGTGLQINVILSGYYEN